MNETEILDQLTSAAHAGTGDLSSFVSDLLQSSRYDEIKSLIEILLALFANPACGQFDARKAYMRHLPERNGSKCRCDSQWYASEGVENIAFGCKTCAKSSASCICVNCFEAGDHEGHDFYVSKSDYGCCDCGDIFAWKSSGFCNRHPGPLTGDDPTARLETWTLKVGQAVVRSVESHILSLILEDDFQVGSHQEVVDSLLSFLIELNRLHDGLRRIIGNELLRSMNETWNYSIADGILPVSHSLPAYTRQLWTNFVVDLMLDLDFKSRFASVFVSHYSQMVIERTTNSSRPFQVNRAMMSDIGDFTCQVFTRPDVALAQVIENELVSVLLTTMKTILNSALLALDLESLDLGPSHDISEAGGGGILTIIDHGSSVIRNQDFFQCSMDLIYILDHPEVVEVLIKSDNSFWGDWLDIMEKLQFMNPHRRRTDTHVEFPDANWAAALTTQADLFMPFWIFLDGLLESAAPLKIKVIEEVAKRLDSWNKKFEQLERHQGDQVYSLFCPLNRILGILLFDFLDHQRDLTNIPQLFSTCNLASLPLEAIVFHSQVSLGLWKRNGESVNMESEFYKSSFFHHHLASADLTVARLSFLFPKAGGFDSLFRSWCESFGVPFDYSTQLVETCTSALNGFLLFLAQMMSQQNELSLTESGLVKHRIVCSLAVQERTFSQLRDPKLERWTHTMMPRNNALLEECLEQVALRESSLFTLSQRSWLSLDLVAPNWSWKDSQKAEERLLTHLRGNKMSLEEWFKCNKSMQPILKPHFQETFQNFISSEYLLGIVFTVCRYLLDVKNKTDSRSLKLVIQIILRLCYPLGPYWRSNSCCSSPPINLLDEPETTVPTISSIAAAFSKHSRSWCHPWVVTMQGSSILSMLKELALREQTLETKNWIELCVSQISIQCSASSGRPHTDEICTSASAQTKREEASSIKERLLNSIKNRQNKFLLSDGSINNNKSSTSTKVVVSCVICLSEEEGGKIGKLGFVSESAFPCFQKPHHFISRTCDHAVHLDCWKSHQMRSPATLRGFSVCPYCNRPVNIVFAQHDEIYDVNIAFLTSFTHSASPESAILILIDSQIDQLALSIRKPNPESDIPSLEKALPLLLQLLSPDLCMRVRMSGDKKIGEMISAEWVENVARYSKILHSKYPQLPRQKFIEVIEMCMLPWLWKTHVKLHYIVSPSLFELPFEEIASIESALAVSDEFSILLQHLDPLVTLTPLGEASCMETEEDSSALPILCFDLSTCSGEPSLPNHMEPKYFESFLKRDKSVRFIQFKDLRFVECFPSIIPKLPSVYQRLYTSFLQSKCLECNSVPRRAVICLICGALLCFNSECCQVGDLGEVSHHFSSLCARNGIGAFLQLSNSEIHLISSDQGRVMLAQWGSLYLDSHGEEDFGLSKPLQLNIPRMQKLMYEIRENSWVWRQSSKNLVWRIPIGII